MNNTGQVDLSSWCRRLCLFLSPANWSLSRSCLNLLTLVEFRALNVTRSTFACDWIGVSTVASGVSGSGELNVGMNTGDSGVSCTNSCGCSFVTSIFSVFSIGISSILDFLDFSFPCLLLLFLEGVVSVMSSLELLPLFVSMIIVSERKVSILSCLAISVIMFVQFGY